MTVLERLKLELNNKEYLTDAEYIQFLTENNLISTDAYDKATMQRSFVNGKYFCKNSLQFYFTLNI